MKRLSICTLLAVTLAACGGGEKESKADQSPQQPAAGSSAADAGAADAADDSPHKTATITMSVAGGGFPAECRATTSPDMVDVMRRHKVRWTIVNDSANPCGDLEFSKVEVHLDDAVLADGTSQTETAIKIAKPKGNRHFIQQRVHANRNIAKDKMKAKYTVFYKDKQAGPDPELDIDGDCTSCGPGTP